MDRYILFIFITILSCGTNKKLLKRIQNNELAILELKQTVDSLHVTISDLENKLILMKEQLDKLSECRSNENGSYSVPNLPVYHVEKKGGTPLNKKVEEEKPLEIKTIDEYGNVIPLNSQSPHSKANSSNASNYEGNGQDSIDFHTTDDPQSLYQTGYKAISMGNDEKGRKILFAFLIKYGDSDLADNALYWIGESYYKNGALKEALKYFQRIIDDYPSGNKVPDAMVKSAIIFTRLNNIKMAKYLYKQVISIYPDSSAAKVARLKLKQIK